MLNLIRLIFQKTSRNKNEAKKDKKEKNSVIKDKITQKNNDSKSASKATQPQKISNSNKVPEEAKTSSFVTIPTKNEVIEGPPEYFTPDLSANSYTYPPEITMTPETNHIESTSWVEDGKQSWNTGKPYSSYAYPHRRSRSHSHIGYANYSPTIFRNPTEDYHW